MSLAANAAGMLQLDVTTAPTLQDQIFQHFLGQLVAHESISEPTVDAFRQLILDGSILSKEKILRAVRDGITDATGAGNGDTH